jgi:hypothetical protein
MDVTVPAVTVAVAQIVRIFPSSSRRQVLLTVTLESMKPDGDKKSLFSVDRLIAAVGVILAALGYLRPPDPAHPKRFDFLSHTISIPFWLVLITVLGCVLLTRGITKWLIYRSLRNRVSDVQVPDASSVSVSQIGADKTISTTRARETPPTPKIPPRLRVSITTIEIDGNSSGLALVLRNSGGSDALHIHVGDVQLSRFTIRFSGDISTLAPGTSARPIRPTVVEYPESRKHEIGQAMYESLSTRSSQRADGQFEGTASFYDTNGKEYRATWTYTFFPPRFRAKTLPEPPNDGEEVGPYLIVSEVDTEAVGQNYRGHWR